MLMLRGAAMAVCYVVPWPWLELLILFPMFFVLPYVYVRGIGTGLVVFLDLFIFEKRNPPPDDSPVLAFRALRFHFTTFFHGEKILVKQ